MLFRSIQLNSTNIDYANARSNIAFIYANSSLQQLSNATYLSTGTVNTARLATGTANSSTYLRGDQTWAPVNNPPLINQDNSANSDLYFPTMVYNTVSGYMENAYVANTKLYFNPSSGTLYATAFSNLSDQTIKENVIPLQNSIDILNTLNPVQFSWKENGQSSFGFIAQEVEQVLPQIVSTANNFKSVNYQALIALLVDAVKTQQKEIEELKKK